MSDPISVAPAHVDARRGLDYIGVVLCCVIHDGQGNRLLMKRGMDARDEQGTWDNTGGALEFGETLEDGVAREIREELLTDPIKIDFIKNIDIIRKNDKGHLTHWLGVVYAVEVNPSLVKIGEPHKIAELGWFTSANMPSPLHSQLLKSHLPAQTLGYII